MFLYYFNGILWKIFDLNVLLHHFCPEFELKRVIDDARLDQLKGYTSHKGHIFNRFSWGIVS